MSLRAVVFDFDGVLMDSSGVKTACYRKLAESFGRNVEEFVQYHIANGGISRHVKIRHYVEQILGESLSRPREAELAVRYAACVAEGMESATLAPGAVECLAWASANFPIFLLSGSPQDELDEQVHRKNIADYFERIVGFPATKPETLIALLAERNWKGDDVIYVGDAISDFEASTSEGVRFVGVVTGENRDQFARMNFVKVNSLNELRKVLETEVAEGGSRFS